MLKVPYWKVLMCLFVILASFLFSASTFVSSDSKIAQFLPSKRVNLGLDLRGGAYLLLEMQLDSYDRELTDKYLNQIRVSARAEKIGLKEAKLLPDNNILLETVDPAQTDDLKKIIKANTGNNFDIKTSGNGLILNRNKDVLREQRKQLAQQTMEIISRRVDETGTKEIDVQRQGDNYILLQVPGIDDPNQIKHLLGKTAKLGFHLVVDNANEYTPGVKILPLEDENTGRIINVAVQNRPLLTGDMLVDAQTTVNNGTPIVTFKLNHLGAKIFAEASSKNVGRAFAIVLDNVVISAPVIKEPILGGNSQISGSFTIASANELALLLRAGALPVPLKIAEERSVGPSLGSDSITSGIHAGILGGALVLVFMFIFYYWFGMVANIALTLNFFMIIAVLSIFDATLTMSGIAGIVLTLGMAVDANVLIFERIREELRKGRSALSAIETGYEMAFATIFDSNITTVLAGLILYIFAAGPVKGFAVTLIVGILCSMFTAVTVTKVIISLWFRKYRPAKINV
jgi:preprotein translocase subunit SecD